MIPHPRASAFTLVEMLVSMAVLIILMAMITQLFSSATVTANLSNKHIDEGATASMVFDQMGRDLSRMVKRPDVNYIFCKSGAASTTSGSSDSMFFYTEGPGYLSPDATMTTTGSASTMALAGYRINQSNPFFSGIPVLERLGENLTWAGSPDQDSPFANPGGPVFLPMQFNLGNANSKTCTLAGNWAGTLGTPPYNDQSSQQDTTHFQLLSDSVFRMEFCFLLKGGTYVVSGTTIITSTSGYSNAPTAIPYTVPKPYITDNYFSGGASLPISPATSTVSPRTSPPSSSPSPFWIIPAAK